MSARPARHLQLVDQNTGEIVDSRELGAMQHELEELKTKFKMAQRDVAAKNLRIAALETDKARERLDYERYEDVRRIARYWHKKCRAGNARVNPMSPERFDAVRGILEQERVVWDEPEPGKKRRRKRREPMYSMEECKAAIDGCAFDHFVKKRKNGSEKPYDDLEFIFRDGKNFEECRDRCPYDWKALDVTPRKVDTPSQVPTTPAGHSGQARSEGSYGSSHPLGARLGGVALRAQEGREAVFRGFLQAGATGESAA